MVLIIIVTFLLLDYCPTTIGSVVVRESRRRLLSTSSTRQHHQFHLLLWHIYAVEHYESGTVATRRERESMVLVDETRMKTAGTTTSTRLITSTILLSSRVPLVE